MSVTAPYVTYGNQNMATSATVRVNTEMMGAGRVREYAHPLSTALCGTLVVA